MESTIQRSCLGDREAADNQSRAAMSRRLQSKTAAPSESPEPDHPSKPQCPRCDSVNTKFCYYNNYSLSQPRFFCKACRRYWTRGGTLRNVPVGGGCRKGKRSRVSQPPLQQPGQDPLRPPPSSTTAGLSTIGNPLLQSNASAFYSRGGGGELSSSLPSIQPPSLNNLGGVCSSLGLLPGLEAFPHPFGSHRRQLLAQCLKDKLAETSMICAPDPDSLFMNVEQSRAPPGVQDWNRSFNIVSNSSNNIVTPEFDPGNFWTGNLHPGCSSLNPSAAHWPGDLP